MRKALTIGLAVALLLALVVGVLLWSRGPEATDLQRAAALAPADAERLSWTDWGAVRNRLDAGVDADSSVGELRRFLDRGYEADLTSTSALLESAPGLQEEFGFSPASVEWELFSQSATGAVVILGLPGSTDFDALADRLEGLGYQPPSSPDGVWDGGADLVASLGVLTPELSFLVIDEDAGVLLASDAADYLARVADGTAGQSEDTGDTGELGAVLAASGEPLSAAVYSGDQACSALAMSQADPGDQQEAELLVREAGEVNPVTGFAMSVQPDGSVRVALSFESDAQARTNADSRAVLAAGPAPGQGGDFADRFEVTSVTADGPVVTLELEPVEGSYVLSDLSTGPVLFATC